jgi:hypothetical protein
MALLGVASVLYVARKQTILSVRLVLEALVLAVAATVAAGACGYAAAIWYLDLALLATSGHETGWSIAMTLAMALYAIPALVALGLSCRTLRKKISLRSLALSMWLVGCICFMATLLDGLQAGFPN